jgi:hypothetical protein
MEMKTCGAKRRIKKETERRFLRSIYASNCLIQETMKQKKGNTGINRRKCEGRKGSKEET